MSRNNLDRTLFNFGIFRFFQFYLISVSEEEIKMSL